MCLPKLALIVPCYNEEEIIKQAYMKLNAKMQRLIDSKKISQESFVCFVDDGSRDKTWGILHQMISKTPSSKIPNSKIPNSMDFQILPLDSIPPPLFAGQKHLHYDHIHYAHIM